MASIFRQQFTTAGENGKRIHKRSQYWYIDYKAAGETRKRVKGFKDKTATAQLAAKLEKEAELTDAGIIDKYKEHRKKLLIEHLDDFKAALLNRGTTEKHACLVYNRAKAVIEKCKFLVIADLSASKVQEYLAGRRKAGLEKAGLSIRSSNFYLAAIKCFCHWLVADGRMSDNPLAYLKAQNPQPDIRHARRALKIDEIQRLLTATAASQPQANMTGRERSMLYALALETGLRASEIASLTWKSFSFDMELPTVTVLAAYSKHRRDDTQPLRPEAAVKLRRWKSETATEESDRVFPRFHKGKAANMLRKDLEAVDIVYRDDAGRVADFHALRHTYITNIVKGGASAKAAQSLARHSKVSLTLDTYTHFAVHDCTAALAGLPQLPDFDLPQNKTADAVALRTGTDDNPVSGAYKPAYKKLAKTAYSDSDQPSTIDTANRAVERVNIADDACDKPISEAQLGNNCHSVTIKNNGEAGIRFALSL